MHSIRSYTDTPAYLSDPELTAILRAPDWQRLRERTLHTLVVFGVDDFMLRMDVTLPNGSMQCCLQGSLPETLLHRFRSELPEDADPIACNLIASSLPYDWDINDICVSTAADAYMQLRMCGVKRGISISVRTEHATSRIDFYRKAAGGFARSAALRANLLLLASYLHEAAKALRGKEVPHDVEALTERELACLRLSAGGKTGKEIGMILGISQRTVYFHMKNIAKKFNVYSTRHAIGRAVAVGLIRPGG